MFSQVKEKAIVLQEVMILQFRNRHYFVNGHQNGENDEEERVRISKAQKQHLSKAVPIYLSRSNHFLEDRGSTSIDVYVPPIRQSKV